MADVFISYKHEDRAIAERLAAALERNVLSVWWDEALQAGDNFRDGIATELDAAGCVIVLWSARSVTAGNFVLSEASRASKRNTLLPVRIEAVDLPLGLDQMQYVDLCEWPGDDDDDNFQRLLRTLSIRLRRGFTSLRPEKRALLIAVDEYARPDDFRLNAVPFAGIEALARALSTSDGTGFKVEVERNPGILKLSRLLQELTEQAAANDLVLLHFAGHARLSPEDGLCLCAADTQPDQLDITGLPLDRLAAKYLNRIAAEQVIVLLDCDFSVVGNANTGIEAALTEALGRGKGKYVIAANVAPLNGRPTNRGAFVRALAEGISTFAADAQHDNLVTVDEWFEYANSAAKAAGAPEARKWAFDVPSGAVEIARRATAARLDTPISDTARINAVGLDFLDRVQSRLRSNKIIPVFGDGIYGSGPLSSFQIVGALARRTRALKSDDTMPLATVAEYCLEANGNDRSQFLGDLREILDDQASRCDPKLAHGFVRRLKEPWLVISTTYDWFLEKRLAEEGVRFMVVAHVLYSDKERHDGEVAVVRFGSEPRFHTCLADELLPATRNEKRPDEKPECIVYKVLGSPFLHDFAPVEDQIDTVVITETDHATFLARLEYEKTRVPTAFAPALQTRHLLFLGYNLDVWHYRLVSHVFSKDGPAHVDKPPFAVRQPTSVMEESFWRRLGCDLVCADAESFARAILHTAV